MYHLHLLGHNNIVLRLAIKLHVDLGCEGNHLASKSNIALYERVQLESW
jgi:hypothetical protein